MSLIVTKKDSTMSLNKINLNNPLPSFEGLTFSVDAFSERRHILSILPILYEEQPFTWKLYNKELYDYFAGRDSIRILDVGCGSGFWGLLLKKKFPEAKVTCLDKNPEAIDRAKYNSLVNALNVSFIEGLYDKSQFACNSFDLIVLTPPYHLYDPKNEDRIPLFARGGKYGLHEFYSQSRIAFEHLKDEGIILFNQMSAGVKEPDYVQFYKTNFKIGNLKYTNILPPIPTISFLQGVYEPLDSDYLKDFAMKMPMLYYTSGIYQKNDSSFEASENTLRKQSVLSEMEGDWQIRIGLHREINNF